MRAADHVVAPTPGSAITIPETANEFAIKEIRAFSQHENESPTDAWLRMKEMIQNCHGHNLAKGNIIKIFYHGLSEITQEVLNAAASGIFLYKTPNQAYQLREDKVLLKLDWAKNKKTKPSFKKIVSFDDEEGMPNYGKFLKELISNKHKIKQISTAFLSDESLAMIQNKVPPKLKDPGSSLISFNFNKAFSCNALPDLGASINIMPSSLNAKLSLETLKPTKMNERLADRSFQYPIGIAENMLVEVGKFTFLVDFIILEMEEDSKVLIILGRPFLHTANAVIRVKQKQLNLGVGTKQMIFNIDSAMKHSHSNDDSCVIIDVIDEILEEDFDALLDEEEPPFEKITINTDNKIKTSLEEPPTDLELKTLPNNLEYVFLKEPSFLPVLEDKKPVVQKQRRLNPNMQEVVRKEIIKLLDTDIIYLIADSPWINPIHCVPKKGGITVVTNKNDALIPTRTVIESVKVFMDDFSVFGNSFETCLNNLYKMLQRCKDAHLVLNWGKCHFMVKEAIVLGHKVSSAELEVDKAK
nr:DNA-directed DNA polymerase [Tanacetum cinerariifolium]